VKILSCLEEEPPFFFSLSILDCVLLILFPLHRAVLLPGESCVASLSSGKLVPFPFPDPPLRALFSTSPPVCLPRLSLRLGTRFPYNMSHVSFFSLSFHSLKQVGLSGLPPPPSSSHGFAAYLPVSSDQHVLISLQVLILRPSAGTSIISQWLERSLIDPPSRLLNAALPNFCFPRFLEFPVLEVDRFRFDRLLLTL